MNSVHNKEISEKKEGINPAEQFSSGVRLFLFLLFVYALIYVSLIQTYKTEKKARRIERCLRTMTNVKSALEMYSIDYKLPCPGMPEGKGQEVSLTKTAEFLKKEKYLRGFPKCYEKGEYRIKNNGNNNFEIICTCHGSLKKLELDAVSYRKKRIIGQKASIIYVPLIFAFSVTLILMLKLKKNSNFPMKWTAVSLFFNLFFAGGILSVLSVFFMTGKFYNFINIYIYVLIIFKIAGYFFSYKAQKEILCKASGYKIYIVLNVLNDIFIFTGLIVVFINEKAIYLKIFEKAVYFYTFFLIPLFYVKLKSIFWVSRPDYRERLSEIKPYKDKSLGFIFLLIVMYIILRWPLENIYRPLISPDHKHRMLDFCFEKMEKIDCSLKNYLKSSAYLKDKISPEGALSSKNIIVKKGFYTEKIYDMAYCKYSIVKDIKNQNSFSIKCSKHNTLSMMQKTKVKYEQIFISNGKKAFIRFAATIIFVSLLISVLFCWLHRSSYLNTDGPFFKTILLKNKNGFLLKNAMVLQFLLILFTIAVDFFVISPSTVLYEKTFLADLKNQVYIFILSLRIIWYSILFFAVFKGLKKLKIVIISAFLLDGFCLFLIFHTNIGQFPSDMLIQFIYILGQMVLAGLYHVKSSNMLEKN